MARHSDKQPKAVAGKVMRRTDEHVIANSIPDIKRSGDQHIKGKLSNDTLDSYPDSANDWGKTPLDPDWVGD